MILQYILLIVMIILWSFNFIVVSFAVEYIPPLSIALYRFIIASISFLIIDFYVKLSGKKKKEVKVEVSHEKFTKQDWILIFVLSLVGQSLYFYTLYNAVDLIGPSLPALFVCLLSPVIIAILALFIFDEKLDKIKIIGFIIAVAGAFLLVTGGDINNFTPKSPNFMGYIFTLITPLLWGIYTILTKKLCKDNSMLDILKYTCYLATIQLFIFVVLSGELQIFIEQLLNPIVILCAIYIGLICHVIGYYIWQYSQKNMDSSKAASFLYFEPFITLIFSIILQIDETIVLWNIIGGIIVLFAVLIINVSEKSVSECVLSES